MLEKYILKTPLIQLRGSAEVENVFMKPENLQIFGSYKIRGVASAVSSANRQKLNAGIETISAGNMAQAVAFAANILRLRCRIYIPESAPEIKKIAVRKLGVEVIERSFAEIWNMVKDYSKGPHEGLLIHPVFTEALLDGYGNIADEIVDDMPGVDAVVIPFGVGGLTLGVARKLRQLKPDVKIYVCEPAGAAPVFSAFESGRSVQIERKASFVDAIGTPEILPQIFHEVRDLVCESIRVSEEDAKLAIREVFLNHKMICEGAAGVSLAAALMISKRNLNKKIVCILSGGNISAKTLSEIMEH